MPASPPVWNQHKGQERLCAVIQPGEGWYMIGAKPESFVVCWPQSKLGRTTFSPLSSEHQCCTSDIPVPWKESAAVVDVGLWSILSTAVVVNRPLRKDGGWTPVAKSKRSVILFAKVAETCNKRSYDTDKPRWNSLSTRSCLRVSACIIVNTNAIKVFSIWSDCSLVLGLVCWSFLCRSFTRLSMISIYWWRTFVRCFWWHCISCRLSIIQLTDSSCWGSSIFLLHI